MQPINTNKPNNTTKCLHVAELSKLTNGKK